MPKDSSFGASIVFLKEGERKPSEIANAEVYQKGTEALACKRASLMWQRWKLETMPSEPVAGFMAHAGKPGTKS